MCYLYLTVCFLKDGMSREGEPGTGPQTVPLLTERGTTGYMPRGITMATTVTVTPVRRGTQLDHGKWQATEVITNQSNPCLCRVWICRSGLRRFLFEALGLAAQEL